jgi:hypothetical protein
MENGSITDQGQYQPLKSRLQFLNANSITESPRPELAVHSLDQNKHLDVSKAPENKNPDLPSSPEKHEYKTTRTVASNSFRIYKFYVASLGFKQSLLSLLLLMILWGERVYSSMLLRPLS